jgi:thiol-disulfide isomerase/thioredoxin
MEVSMTTQRLAIKQQQCSVPGLALSWAGYLAGLAFLAYQRNWAGGVLWLAVVPSIRLALYRYFPSLSRFLGYGRVDDEVPAQVNRAPVTVVFYSFFSCPFCPIVLQRLEALQKKMDFTLEKIDVTFNPQILMRKQIRSVPVVEVGSNRLIGNATTEELARFIGHAQPLEPFKAA